MNWEELELPSGWTVEALGDLAKVVGGGTPSTSVPGNFSDSGGHPWITPADLTNHTDRYISRGRRFLTAQGLATSTASYVPRGSVLFSTRAPIGHVAIARNPLTTNQGFRTFVPGERVTPEFLYYALQLLKPTAQRLASGTTFPELSGTKAARLRIVCPPIAEQDRIVAALDKLADTRTDSAAHLNTALLILERLRKAALSAASSGRLSATWRANHDVSESALELFERIQMNRKALAGKNWKPPTAPRDLELFGGLPDSWTWTTCEALCRPDRALTYGVIKLGREVAEGVPTLRSSDVRRLYIDERAIKSIDPAISEDYRRTVLQGGEVVVTVRGSLGGVAVVPAHMAGFNVSREVAVVPVVPEVDPNFLSFVIAGLTSQNWLTGVSKGVAYTGINIRDLAQLPVPLPPFEEQREIGRRVKSLFGLADSLIPRIKSAYLQVDRSALAALAKAFRGKLVSTNRE